MRLYFQSGNKRIALNTDTKAYNRNYSFLGGWADYIKVGAKDYKKIESLCYMLDWREVSSDEANEEATQW